MSDPIKIDSRFSYIPDEGSLWRLLDATQEFDEFHVPKRFAETPEKAVELRHYLKQQCDTAFLNGMDAGERNIASKLRGLINAAPLEP